MLAYQKRGRVGQVAADGDANVSAPRSIRRPRPCDTRKTPRSGRRPVFERPGTEAAEHQANEFGAALAEDFDSAQSHSGQSDPLPQQVQVAAEARLGVPLEGVRFEWHPEAQAKRRAKATTEGSTISFARAPGVGTATDRQLLGHELVHVAQQRATGQRAVQHSPEDDSETGNIWPPRHFENQAKLDLHRQQEQTLQGSRENFQSQLDKLPQASPERQQEQSASQQLRRELDLAGAALDQELNSEIKLIDNMTQELDTALGMQSASPENEAQRQLQLARAQLANERASALKHRRKLSRERLEELPLLNVPAGEHEKRKKQLAEFLSGTATHRAAPGTRGTGKDGRSYVVFQRAVRVGGSIPWRNRNPGNVQRSPSGGDPPGVLGIDQFSHYIFETERAGKLAVFFDLQTRRGGPGATLKAALRSYIAGGKKDSQLPTTKEECAARGIAPAVCVTKEAAQTYATKVAGTAGLDVQRLLRDLSPDERLRLVDAILTWEGGANPKAGDEYTCASRLAPGEYRTLLGCDE